jgi:Flp pilus assembly protein TadB
MIWLLVIVFVAFAFIALYIVRMNKVFNNHESDTEKDSHRWWERKTYISLFSYTKNILVTIGYKNHWSVFMVRTLVFSFMAGLLGAFLLKSVITFILCFIIGMLLAYHKKVEQYSAALSAYDEDFLTLLETFVIHYRDYGNTNHTLTGMVQDLDNSMRYPSQVLANSLEAGESIDKALERFYKASKNRWARSYGSLIVANYYHGGDIITAFRDFMNRVRSSMGYMERKKASQSYTVVALYIGMVTQPILLGISMFITQGFSDVLFHTDFGVSVLNTVLLIDIVSYSVIRSVQSRGLYDVN